MSWSVFRVVLLFLGLASLMHVSLGLVLEQKASRIETEVLDLHF